MSKKTRSFFLTAAGASLLAFSALAESAEGAADAFLPQQLVHFRLRAAVAGINWGDKIFGHGASVRWAGPEQSGAGLCRGGTVR